MYPGILSGRCAGLFSRLSRMGSAEHAPARQIQAFAPYNSMSFSGVSESGRVMVFFW